MSWGFIKTTNKHHFTHFINVDDVTSITKFKVGSYPGSPPERWEIRLKSTSEVFFCDKFQFVSNDGMTDIRNAMYPGINDREASLHSEFYSSREAVELRREMLNERIKEFEKLHPTNKDATEETKKKRGQLK